MRCCKKVIEEYDLTRVFAVILVVIGHCTYYTISTKYGGIDYSGIMKCMNVDDTIVHKLLQTMVNIIYSFHMPLFVALSGCLFSIQLQKNRYYNLKSLVKDKFYRLLIPFLLITLLYVVPLKLISNYFSSNYLIAIKEIILGQFLLMGNTSLWYLPSLFINFIIIYIIEKMYKGNTGLKFIIFFGLNVISYKIAIPLFYAPMRYTIWFYIGLKFEDIRQRMNIFIKNNKNILPITLVIFIITYYLNTHVITTNILMGGVKVILRFGTAFLGCFLIYSLSYYLTFNTNIMKCKFIKMISNNSFGIYLYSDTLNYLILFLIYSIFGIEIFGDEYGALIIFLIRLIFTSVISIYISKFLKTKNVKYIC